MVSNILLDRVDKKWYLSICARLAKQSLMWDDTFGNISATEHLIDLKKDVKTVRQNAYRSSHKERKFSWREIKKMLQSGVIELSNSEWASLIVIAPI